MVGWNTKRTIKIEVVRHIILPTTGWRMLIGPLRWHITLRVRNKLTVKR